MVDDLLTIAETAKRLHVSRRCVDRLIAERRLTVCRMGPRLVRIRESDIRAYLDSVTQPAETGDGAAYRGEKTICLTKEKIPSFGGSVIRMQAESALDALLKRRHTQTPKPSNNS